MSTRPRRRLHLAILVLLIGTLVLPAAASATYRHVLLDCADPAHNEQLTKTYKHDEYQGALDHMPSDMKEYTDCYDVIDTAMHDVAAGGTGIRSGSRSSGNGQGGSGGNTQNGNPGTPRGNSTGSSASPTATDPLATATTDDRAALEHARQQRARPVQVGTALITPGRPSAHARSLDSLPWPLLLVLGIAFGVMLGGAGLFVRRRISG